MSVIRRIDELHNAGKNDGEIVSILRSEGYSPRDIDESLSQYSIKSAVSHDSRAPIPDSSMQESIMNAPQQSEVPVPTPIPSPARAPAGPKVSDYSQSYSDYSGQDSYPQQGGLQDQGFQPYDYSQPAPQSSETVSEIAEQVVDEKLSKVKKELSQLDDFKSGVDTKINLLKERLKRIEGIIDTLQDSIVRKIGEYGENIQDLGNDLRTTQESFSKVVSPLLEKSKSYTVRRVRRKKKKSSKKKS